MQTTHCLGLLIFTRIYKGLINCINLEKYCRGKDLLRNKAEFLQNRIENL